MGYSDGEEAAIRPVKSSQLDGFCSANNSLQDDSKGVVATGGTARMTLNAPSYPTASQTDHKGLSPTGFSGGPVNHYQGNQAVDVWSNHACSGGSVNSFFPGLRTCTPWQRRQMASRTRGRANRPVISKATKDQSSGCYWQGVHPKLEGAVGPSFFKGPVIFRVLNDSQAIQRRIVKGTGMPS